MTTPEPWPVSHSSSLRSDPELWVDVDQVERESHEAWEAAEAASRARAAAGRTRSLRRRKFAARFILAVVFLLHLAALLCVR